MRSIIHVLIIFLMSINCLAMTICNQSNVAVVFRFHEGKYSHFINVKSGDSVQLKAGLEEKLVIEQEASNLFRFHEIARRYEEVFIRTDNWTNISFILSGDEEIESMSAYRKLIIKNADPNMYEGLSIELLKKHPLEFDYVLDPSECIGCSNFMMCLFDALGIATASSSPES